MQMLNTRSSECLIQKIFKHCFLFLQIFCLNDNKINKKVIYKQKDFLFKFPPYIELGQTELLIEVYLNNYKAVWEVTEDIITLFLQRLGTRHTRYLRFLYQLLWFRHQPVLPNFEKLLRCIKDV